MANLTAERSVPRYGTDENVLPWLINLPMSASLKIFKGAMVAASTVAATAGQAVKGGAATTQQIIGIAEATVDNSSGAASALNINVRSGVFPMANSAGADAIAAQHIGHPAYAVDDQTVALGDNGGARPLAGIVVFVDSTGVWVAMGIGASPNVVETALPFFQDFTAYANAATVLAFTPQFAGKIKKITMSCMKAATGAGATATLTPSIAAVALTGGVLTPTLANMTAGAEVAATAITAGQQFSSGQQITVAASAVTAFTAGSGSLVLHIG